MLPAPSGATFARVASDTGSIRRVSPADPPPTGRPPMAWRPGPAHQEGFVPAFIPGTGETWIPLEQANKLPVRARGTVSQHAYAVAKEPSEVDDEWRQRRNGASPGPNPLMLTDVPVAGPSASTVHRGQYDGLPGSSMTGSTLFRNVPVASDRTIIQSTSTAPDTHSRPIARRNSTRSQIHGPLALELSALPEPRESPPAPPSGSMGVQPSPAMSWGTVPSNPTRNSSLANLNLQGLPDPDPFPRPIDSAEQFPVGEHLGGPIVLIPGVTPYHTDAFLLPGGNMSVSGHSDSSHGGGLGIGLSASAGSSGVITSLRDLEEVNRSLQQLSAAQAREEQEDAHSLSSRSSRSSRHSRQVSFSEVEDMDSPIVPRIGIPIYSFAPASAHASQRASNDPSPPDPSPPVPSPPRSRASNRHGESVSGISSNHNSYNNVSHRPSESTRRRSRRGSLALLSTFPTDPSPSWNPAPLDISISTSSQGPYRSAAPSQKSQDSIPRAFGSSLEIPSLPNAIPGSMSSLLLNFGPENNTSAVDADGEEAAGIHAPRPVSGRRSSFFGNAWGARSSR
ncbi:uncharacterized protein BXZ73DRAFT_52377 [Epithele typhae]|uniref:uncharacterized protein n=1 Tax=Epithele typhae TaxID=378194 RepID=UPI00200827B7|nr:uncharacterized protein BXZ73DRAFT_52377 [Epithele typhae]KAH9920015.1 hypothetical protein BXZ73DRAFT_52377 [Epithele typhae]